MSRFLYTLCFYLAQPLVWLRLLWRARKQPEYLQHLGERYGIYEGKEKPGAAEIPCAITLFLVREWCWFRLWLYL